MNKKPNASRNFFITLILIAGLISFSWLLGGSPRLWGDRSLSDTEHAPDTEHWDRVRREIEQRQQAEREVLAAGLRPGQKESGLHCLSARDGSHPGLKRAIKANMGDPDSFEHIETKITKIDPDSETYGVFMKYRGRNAFNALIIDSVGARIDDRCKLVDIIDL
ncbi:MAG: hypothetical protein OXU54_04995 [Gammaproteobacteria bacterium]|nr:hypothetical protein [Gammaproteobacteria bacterium]